MTNILVQANNPKKHFGKVHGVDDVSLQIKAGKVYGLVGADGAGKTTTMRDLLVGALLPDHGDHKAQRAAETPYSSTRTSPLFEQCTAADRQ